MMTYTMTGFKINKGKRTDIEIHAHGRSREHLEDTLALCFVSISSMMPKHLRRDTNSKEMANIITSVVNDIIDMADRGEIQGIPNPDNTHEIVFMTDDTFEKHYHLISDAAVPEGATIQ